MYSINGTSDWKTSNNITDTNTKLPEGYSIATDGTRLVACGLMNSSDVTKPIFTDDITGTYNNWVVASVWPATLISSSTIARQVAWNGRQWIIIVDTDLGSTSATGLISTDGNSWNTTFTKGSDSTRPEHSPEAIIWNSYAWIVVSKTATKTIYSNT